MNTATLPAQQKHYVRVYSEPTQLYFFQWLTDHQISEYVLRGYNIHSIEQVKTSKHKACIEDMISDMSCMVGNYLIDELSSHIECEKAQNFGNGIDLALTVLIESLGLDPKSEATDRVQSILEGLVARMVDKFHTFTISQQKG